MIDTSREVYRSKVLHVHISFSLSNVTLTYVNMQFSDLLDKRWNVLWIHFCIMMQICWCAQYWLSVLQAFKIVVVKFKVVLSAKGNSTFFIIILTSIHDRAKSLERWGVSLYAMWFSVNNVASSVLLAMNG